ncbi:NAD-dependent epimerase/dehydratase family protein [Polynucleobacter sp. MWH-UH19D]|uniref:NAD-dependent epimerase/dehydratase family protein n=1 Tax=Polynucleobacter sp. MWH-UH19D TaxID=1855610 RepID=UPI003364C18D
MPKSSSTLLIGGAGFIGSHLAPLLAQNGRQVQVLGRSEIAQQKIPTIQYIQGDFNNADLLEALVKQNNEVVHLAYATVPNTSFNDPLLDLNENLPPVLRLMQLCAKHQKRLVLLSSGGAVYGQSQSVPIAEDHPTLPISPYGLTKLTIEHYAYLFSVSHGLSYISLRPGNPYGLGQIPFRGQGFIATALALIEQNRAVQVFGSQGTIRDYLEINDLAAGILAAMDHGQVGQIYNIGSGVGRSNLDVLNTLAPIVAKLGYEVQIEQLPARPFDVAVNVLDSTKLMSISGWKPKIDLQDGLESLVDSLFLGKPKAS